MRRTVHDTIIDGYKVEVVHSAKPQTGFSDHSNLTAMVSLDTTGVRVSMMRREASGPSGWYEIAGRERVYMEQYQRFTLEWLDIGGISPSTARAIDAYVGRP